MNPIFEKVRKSYDYIGTVTDFTPDVALVLGSGLGEFAKHMEVECEIPYCDIEGFPISTVAGHDGRFLFGTVEGVKTVIMKGRVHYRCCTPYQTYDNARCKETYTYQCGRCCKQRL